MITLVIMDWLTITGVAGASASEFPEGSAITVLNDNVEVHILFREMHTIAMGFPNVATAQRFAERVVEAHRMVEPAALDSN